MIDLSCTGIGQLILSEVINAFRPVTRKNQA